MRTPRFVVASFALSTLVACAKKPEPAAPAAAETPTEDPCPVPSEGATGAPATEACSKGTLAACETECEEGRSGACFLIGLALEGDDDHAAQRAYARACRLGEAIGCTNLGAHAFMGKADVAPACALRLFDAACERDDAYGCGMVARTFAEGYGRKKDVDMARMLLGNACTRFGNFPCWVLGTYLIEGQLGPADAEAGRTALERACKTGFKRACKELDENKSKSDGA